MRVGVVGALLGLAFAAAGSTHAAQASYSPFPGPQIYSIGIDGHGRRNLSTARGWDDRLARSPDGRRLAFVRWQPRGVPGEGEEGIWTMTAEGTGERELFREGGPRCQYCLGKPAWSPDGTRLAVTRAGPEAGLWIVDAETGAARRLADATADLALTAPSWSPDSRSVAFHYADSSTCGPGAYKNCATWSVRVVRADGTGLRVVATKASEPRWSRTGRWIAYRITDGGESLGLGVVRPDGRSRRRVYPPRLRISGVGAFRWSPDGRRLVFVGVSRTVLAARPDRRGVHRTRLIGLPVEGFFEWSPDRRRIAAIWSPDSSTSTQVWVQNADGTKRRRVTDEHHEGEIPGGPFLRDVSWSRNGKRLFYVF